MLRNNNKPVAAQDSIDASSIEQNAQLAAALLEANERLSQQKEEMEKRAAELVTINSELAFQMEEKEKRAAELEAAVKELEAFSYSVSHDLRAPLRAINGFTQVLVEDYSDRLDGEARLMLDEIVGNSRKMGNLIDNLLEFSRIGKQLASLMKVDMEALVISVIKELKQLEPTRDISITVKPLPMVKGDKNMLRQVFMNLLSNAFKYTGKKLEPIIEVGAYEDSGFYTFYVKDNGAGFDMRYYDKLFGVFQRLHSSNEFDGNGVGLAIIHKIITKHNGKAWAEGKVNEGACFFISLPIN